MESLSSFDPFKFGSKRNNHRTTYSLLTKPIFREITDPGSGTGQKIGIF